MSELGFDEGLLDDLATDPVLFARHCLRFQPWTSHDAAHDGQIDILRAVGSCTRVAVRSAQKTGKSKSAASCAIWWAVTRPNAKVILTAPTYEQVKKILWPEIRALYRQAIEGGLKLSGEGPGLDPGTGWRLGPDSMIWGRTTDKPERMQGLSGADSFYIVDEASGYSEAMFEALFGNLAGGGRILLISNPNHVAGTFYDAFHEKRHLWKTLHVRSIDNPNFHGGNVPGLATPGWLAEQAESWGEGSPAYLVRALGEFPTGASDAVIPLALVEAAKIRRADKAFAEATEPLHFGVDVGRGGDDTVIVPRRGYTLGPIAAFNGLASEDGPTVAGRVMLGVRALRRPGERPVVKVDIIGYGASAYDALKPSASGPHPEIELVGVNSGQRSDDERQYHNLRAQLWFGLRSWLKDGGQLPSDARLCGECVTPRWKPDERGRVIVELKDNIKKRLGRSPDRADALAMAVYDRAIGYSGALPPVLSSPSPMAEA